MKNIKRYNLEAKQIYLVGGAVRDKLLGLPIIDCDWVVIGSTPEQMLTNGFRAVGKDFPVFLHPITNEEYALARTESKTGHGYTGFSCNFDSSISLEQDLMRRDLTINAMAENKDGNIIDPYNGKQDIENKILRHVSPSFAEDPLRVFRVARFAAKYADLGFTIASQTLDLMREIVASGELQYISPERIWLETEKALTTNKPEVYFAVLNQVNALDTSFPELSDLFTHTISINHKFDTLANLSLLRLQYAQQLSSNQQNKDLKSIRFACLCLNLDEPNYSLDNFIEYKQQSYTNIDNLCSHFKLPTHYKYMAYISVSYCQYIHNAFNLVPEFILALFNRLQVWHTTENLFNLLLVCEADYYLMTNAKNYPQADYLKSIYNSCLHIDTQAIIKQGIVGKDIKLAQDKIRLNLIREQQIKLLAQKNK